MLTKPYSMYKSRRHVKSNLSIILLEVLVSSNTVLTFDMDDLLGLTVKAKAIVS
jgi:hypothetical protein